MEINPYQPPATDLETENDVENEDSLLRVDGKLLVLRTGAELPLFCVKTNVPIQLEDMKKKHFTWASPTLVVVFLLSPVIYAIVYLILRKHCDVTYGLSPIVRAKYRKWRWIKIIIATVLFCALPVVGAIDSDVSIYVCLILFIIAFVAIFIGQSPLTIAKHKKGEFWIRGCSNEFLAQFQP